MKDYDVVIVGAGLAGALIAHKMAENGAKALVLEAGPDYGDLEDHLDAYYAANAKIPSAPWADSPQAGRPTVLDFADSSTWQDPKRFYMVQKGPLPFASTYERLPGGTANHWLGTALRLVPSDFRLASEYGVAGARDWPITYEDLELWYGEAERSLGVSGDPKAWNGYLGAHRSSKFPMSAIPQSYLDQRFKTTVDHQQVSGKEVEVLSTPQARNHDWYWSRDKSGSFDRRPPCVGNTSCVPICPVRAKYDPNVHLRRARGDVSEDGSRVAEPAEIRHQSVAYRVEVDAAGRVSGIHYKDWAGNEAMARGRIYVLCAHAIETAKLLQISPWKREGGRDVSVANSSDQVGRNLMDHTILLAWGLTRDPVHPFRGPLSTSGIGTFRDGLERGQRAAYIIEIGNDGWSWPTGAPFRTLWDLVHEQIPTGGPWWGKALKQAMRDHCSRQIRLAAEFEDLPSPNSRVLPSNHRDALGIPRPEVHYDLAPYTRNAFVEASATLSSLLRLAGVEKPLSTIDPRSPAVFQVGEDRFQYFGAGHIMGTLRMGAEPEDSVVDANCRTHDHDNLYAVGSGVFPSTGTANPSLTIAALALRASKTILDRLGK